MDTRPQARLRQQQAQQHQDQSQQRSAVAARRAQNRQRERFSFSPRDQSQQRPAVAARRAQNRQRERFSFSLTMANPAQPESIVTNKSLLLACQVYCFTYYCSIAVLLYWVGSWVHSGWCSAVLYVLLHCCSDVRTAALLFYCM